MSRYIDADKMLEVCTKYIASVFPKGYEFAKQDAELLIATEPSIDIVQCQDCKKSHIDGKTTHYLWCVEWGRSADIFGFCERGEREGE